MSGSLGKRGVREVEKGDRLMLNNLGGNESVLPQECKEAAWGAYRRSLEERGAARRPSEYVT
jgi:hypothetical protein